MSRKNRTRNLLIQQRFRQITDKNKSNRALQFLEKWVGTEVLQEYNPKEFISEDRLVSFKRLLFETPIIIRPAYAWK